MSTQPARGRSTSRLCPGVSALPRVTAPHCCPLPPHAPAPSVCGTDSTRWARIRLWSSQMPGPGDPSSDYVHRHLLPWGPQMQKQRPCLPGALKPGAGSEGTEVIATRRVPSAGRLGDPSLTPARHRGQLSLLHTPGSRPDPCTTDHVASVIPEELRASQRTRAFL